MIGETRAHPTDEELHCLADGTLGASARGAVARHADGCRQCTALVERVSALLAAVDAAPRAIEPPADLWPEIRRRIEAGPSLAADRPMGLRQYARLAAAAVVLVTVSVLVTREVVQRTADVERGIAVEGWGTGPPVRAASYEEMDRVLATLLAEHRTSLRPETIAALERNLAIIDGAIAEIRAALSEDPGNPVLRDLLQASYGQKAALLRQVSRT